MDTISNGAWCTGQKTVSHLFCKKWQKNYQMNQFSLNIGNKLQENQELTNGFPRHLPFLEVSVQPAQVRLTLGDPAG